MGRRSPFRYRGRAKSPRDASPSRAKSPPAQRSPRAESPPRVSHPVPPPPVPSGSSLRIPAPPPPPPFGIDHSVTVPPAPMPVSVGVGAPPPHIPPPYMPSTPLPADFVAVAPPPPVVTVGGAAVHAARTQTETQPQAPWTCASCNFSNAAGKPSCVSCRAERPHVEPSVELAIGGLPSDVSKGDVFSSLQSILTSAGRDAASMLRKFLIEPRGDARSTLLRFNSVDAAQSALDALRENPFLAGVHVTAEFHHRPRKEPKAREQRWRKPKWSSDRELHDIITQIDASWESMPQEARDFFNEHRNNICPPPPVGAKPQGQAPPPPPLPGADEAADDTSAPAASAPKMSIAERLAAAKNKARGDAAAAADVSPPQEGVSPASPISDGPSAPKINDIRARLAAKKKERERLQQEQQRQAEDDASDVALPWPPFHGTKSLPARFGNHVGRNDRLILSVPGGFFHEARTVGADDESRKSTFGYLQFTD